MRSVRKIKAWCQAVWLDLTETPGEKAAREAEALRQQYLRRTGRRLRPLPDGIRSRTLFGPDGTKQEIL